MSEEKNTSGTIETFPFEPKNLAEERVVVIGNRTFVREDYVEEWRKRHDERDV